MKFPGSIKVRIEVPGQGPWFATSVQHRVTPEKTVEFLNKLAKKQGTGASYTLATQAQYDEYKAVQRADIDAYKAVQRPA